MKEARPAAAVGVPPAHPPPHCGETRPAETTLLERLQNALRPVAPGPRQLRALVGALRAGRRVKDSAFDAIYPPEVRELSNRHWTPVGAARRAARMLALDAETRVLDVGSGVGKFCLVAALTTPGRFVGIERRGHLVELARSIGAEYGAHRAEYLHGDIAELDWSAFEAFYFFNPFIENILGRRERIDDTVDLTPRRYNHDTTVTRDRLAEARPGTRVVTYHGPRAIIPSGYDLADYEPWGTDALELWIKV